VAKVFGKAVRVEVVDVDRYKRESGRISLGDRFLNTEMVRDGFDVTTEVLLQLIADV